MVRTRHNLEVLGESGHLGGSESHVRIAEGKIVKPVFTYMNTSRVDDQTVAVQDLTVHGVHCLLILGHCSRSISDSSKSVSAPSS